MTGSRQRPSFGAGDTYVNGSPLCGREDKEVTCEVCGRDVGADDARVVQADRPWHHEIRVCSVPCARAASAGEHRE